MQKINEVLDQDRVAGLNKSSRFDHYREVQTALDAEIYGDRLKHKAFGDCFVGVRLDIN